MPLHTYTYLDERNNSKEFRKISNKILEGDSKYFADIAQSERTSYLVECTLVFNKNLGKINSLDFAGLPTVRRILESDIGNHQFFEFKRTKASFNKMAPKLVSDLIDGTHTEYIDVLFFLQLLFAAEITKVHKIVSFKTSDYLKDYCVKLSKMRTETTSKVLNKVYKTYTNALAG